LGHRFVGKAIDNRVSLALMTHLIAEVACGDLAYELTIAAAVQEEIGLIGATSLGAPARFGLAIAIDNGPIADYAGTDRDGLPVQLGGGQTIVYRDSLVRSAGRVSARLEDIAAGSHVTVQPGVYQGVGSDDVALMRAGIPTALLAVSTRYTPT